MTAMASIAGTGIVSHFGAGLECNLNAIFNGEIASKPRQIQQFADPLLSNFVCVDDALSATDAEQYLYHLLKLAVDEALEEKSLSAPQLRSMPVYIGSSSYGIAMAEQLYQRSKNQAGKAIALPLDGFTQITDYLRREFGLMGPDFAFNTACTASANALLCAAQAIALGQCDHALVIGIETLNLTTSGGFAAMQLLSTDQMRPFDARRSGLVLGDGCAALLLQKADDSSGAVHISGGASRTDTYSISASNPDGSEIALLIDQALKTSGISAQQVNGIKAHGTASPLNDVGEAAAMRTAFETVPGFFCLKPYIGHTLGACGAMETALLAAMLEGGELPASGGFSEPDAALQLQPCASPVSATAGYYMSNFFGFGGNNCALVLHNRGSN